MKGTGVFKTEKEQVIMVEDIELHTFEDIKVTCSKSEDYQDVDGIGKVFPITFIDCDIDYTYGY